MWKTFYPTTTSPEPIIISGETTYLTKPLNEDGGIAYLTYLNQKSSADVTPETNAAVHYWKAIGDGRHICDDPDFFERLIQELQTDPFRDGGPYLVDLQRFYEQKAAAGLSNAKARIDQEFEAAMEGPWNRADYPLMEEWLNLNKKPLEHILAGTELPQCYRPLIEITGPPDLFTYEIEDLFLSHAIAELLELRALRSLQQGKTELAVRDLLAIHRLAHHSSKCPSEFALGSAASIERLAIEGDQSLLSSKQATVELLADYARALKGIPEFREGCQTIENRRLLCLSMMQRLAVSNQSKSFKAALDEWDMSEYVPELWLNCRVDWNEILRETNQQFDVLAGSCYQPEYQQRRLAFDDLELRREARFDLYDQEWGNPIGRLSADLESHTRGVSLCLTDALMPDTDFLLEPSCQLQTYHSLTRLAIALSLYQREKGSLPESLEDLTPNYLTEIPRDPYTSQPFVYRVDNDGALLYSLGKNLIDDGGKPHDEDFQNHDHVFRVKNQ